MRYANLRTATVNVKTADADAELRRVQAYLPANYLADLSPAGILIFGEDRLGWTLDGYVIPRLASGLIFATES